MQTVKEGKFYNGFHMATKKYVFWERLLSTEAHITTRKRIARSKMLLPVVLGLI
jgi:hypothetical protein